MSTATWIDIPKDSDFSLYNFPFGAARIRGDRSRIVSRLGDYVIDLAALAEGGLIATDRDLLWQPVLNDLMAGGRTAGQHLRNELIQLFDIGNKALQDNAEAKAKALVPAQEVEMVLPIAIGDYTDFYSSREHATNVGTMFRDPNNALLPNWLHLPVAYHGRASSIVVSGTPINRPKGQTRPDPDGPPIFGPTQQLDFELEMAFVVCGETEIGESVSTDKAEDYIFGLMLFNDWSARDIQKWEYQPLGPFLAKNFASTVSPWIVTLDALEPFRVAGPIQDPRPLPYLQFQGDKSFNISLEVLIEVEGHQPKQVSESNFKHLYWNMAQQLAHHTVTGCNIRTGDLMASGTISGPEPASYGSMLELSWKGTKPLEMPDGSQRKFIQDGDTVILQGYAETDGIRVGFGDTRTAVQSAA